MFFEAIGFYDRFSNEPNSYEKYKMLIYTVELQDELFKGMFFSPRASNFSWG